MPITRRSVPKKKKTLFDFILFGESYSSLVLGILAVVIVTVLLLGFVHSRRAGRNLNLNKTEVAQNVTTITQTSNETVISSSKVENTPTPTPTIKPTATPTPEPTTKPTVKPTKAVEAHKVNNVSKVNTVTPAPTAKRFIPQHPNVYFVKTGDTLWSIAQSNYKSGYNWVDIARANKLSNPNNIKLSQKLVLPRVEQKNATSEPEYMYQATSSAKTSVPSERITANVYKVQKGDSLWSIAVRAYGDGYKWTEIAKANNVSHPNLIYANTSLKLPRK